MTLIETLKAEFAKLQEALTKTQASASDTGAIQAQLTTLTAKVDGELATAQTEVGRLKADLEAAKTESTNHGATVSAALKSAQDFLTASKVEFKPEATLPELFALITNATNDAVAKLGAKAGDVPGAVIRGGSASGESLIDQLNAKEGVAYTAFYRANKAAIDLAYITRRKQ